MSEADAATIRFYYSFRSPYAWLATEKLDEMLGDLGVPIERFPIFPTPEQFPNDPSTDPDKVTHLVQDVLRLARERGLEVRFPAASETDWASCHAAALGVRALGDEQTFARAVFRKRFVEGLDVGSDAVIADAARDAGLDPDAVLESAHDPSLRARVAAGWGEARERDRVFGVPSFVFAGKLYWGRDRMHFLRSAVERKAGAA